MGWWGSQLSNSEGYFSEPFPSLTITFEEPHTFSTLRIVGDTAREEYPVNFAIKLYTGSTIETISVNGNTSVVYQQDFEPVDNVSKVVLEIYKWSHPNRQVKITEFVISFIVNFSDEDVYSLYIERELTGRTLPGSIETAEAKIELFNKDRRFDEDNVNSPYRAYLKPRKKVTLYIAEKQDTSVIITPEKVATFTRDSDAYYPIDQIDPSTTEVRYEKTNIPRVIYRNGKGGFMIERPTVNYLVRHPFFLEFTGKSQTFTADDSYTQITTTEYLTDRGFNYLFIYIDVNDGSFNGWKIADYFDFTPFTTDEFVFQYIAGLSNRDSYTGGYIWKVYARNENNQLIEIPLTTVEVGNQITFVRQSAWRQASSYNATTLTPQSPTEIARTTWDFSRRANYFVAFYVTGVQLEPGNKPTSLIYGERKPEVVLFNPAKVFTGTPFTVHVLAWTNSTLYRQSTGLHTLFSARNSNGQGLALYLDALDYANNFDAVIRLNDLEFRTNIGTLTQDWHLFTLVCTDTSIRLYIDGTLVHSETGSFTYSFAPEGYVGSEAGNYAWDEIIALFMVDIREWSDQEIYDAGATKILNKTTSTTAYITPESFYEGTKYNITQTLGTFWITEWKSPLQDLATTVKAQNLARVFEDVYYYQDTIETNKTVQELVTDVLLSTNLVTSSQIDIDSAVANEVIPLVAIGKMNVREILQKLAQAFGCVVLIDKDNKIHFKHLSTITAQSSVSHASSTNTYKMDTPARRDLYSIVRVQTSSFILGDSEKLFEKTLSGTVGTNTYKIAWEGAADPSTVTVTISNGPADLTYSVVETKPYGCVVVVTSYEASFTFDILIQGQRYETKSGAIIELQDATLVKDIGEVVLEIKDNPFLQTEAQAQSLANLLLSLYTIPRHTLQFEWAGNVTLDVGDVIDLITPLRTFKGFITKIEWDYDPTEVQTIEARRWE
jgi:hypothetical protein